MSSNLIVQKVTARCAMFWQGRTSLLVAVSGGSDSTAMIHILHGLRKDLGIRRLVVAHVNHGLRGEESDGDERFVADTARSLGLPFFIRRLAGTSLHAPGMEAWARRERYAFFQSIREQEGCPYIATGHTADDQAETILLRIMRGCGLRGLRGILPKRDDGVVRPVIDLTRSDLLEWLSSRNLSYRSDRSNRDRAFARNLVRHELLPLLEKKEARAAQKLVRVATRAQEVWDLAQPSVERWIAAFVQKRADRIVVQKEGLRDEFHAAEALRTMFESYGIPADASHIEQVLNRSSRSTGRYLLPGGVWQWHALRDAIEFRKGTARPETGFSFALTVPGVTDCDGQDVRFTAEFLQVSGDDIPRDNLTVVLDGNACGNRLVFRSWRANDRFMPLGGSRTVGVGSYLAKQKIPALRRRQIGIVEGGRGEIVWIPGVQISQRCAVTPKTRSVLKISYESCPAMP